MPPISVLIVDDSAFVRQMLTEFLSTDAAIQVIGTAQDPFDAREKIKKLNPDVLTLDIEMPGMDGLAFLEKIMTLRPMPVIMVSTLTQRGAHASLQALSIGAIDCIGKPYSMTDPLSLQLFKNELIHKVKIAATAKPSYSAAPSWAAQSMQQDKVVLPDKYKDWVIGIASSTGGVQALGTLLSPLPPILPPIAIVQHIHDSFVSSFTDRLNNRCHMTVEEAVHGKPLECGHAYVAPGKHHLKILRKGGKYVCHLEAGEPVGNHLPSANVLLHSIAEAAGSHAVGIILTGMGKDGADGLLAMKRQQAFTIGQDEATCTVYGMPRCAKEIGAIEKELPLHAISQEIINYFKG